MAKAHSKPGKRLDKTKSKKHAKQSPPPPPAFTNELSSRLLDIDEHVHHLLSCYCFYQASTAALFAGDRDNDDLLLLGLTLTGNWMAEQSEDVLEELEEVREWLKEQH